MEDVLRALPELRDKSTRRRTGSDRPFLALTEVRVQVLSWRGSKGANRAGRDISTEQSTGPAEVGCRAIHRPACKKRRRRARAEESGKNEGSQSRWRYLVAVAGDNWC